MKTLVVVVVAGLWLVATTDQIRIGRDPLQVWTNAVQQAPLKPRPWVNLGSEYEARGASGLREYAYNQAMGLAMARPLAEQRMTMHVVAENRSRFHFDLMTWLHDIS